MNWDDEINKHYSSETSPWGWQSPYSKKDILGKWEDETIDKCHICKELIYEDQWYMGYEENGIEKIAHAQCLHQFRNLK